MPFMLRSMARFKRQLRATTTSSGSRRNASATSCKPTWQMQSHQLHVSNSTAVPSKSSAVNVHLKQHSTMTHSSLTIIQAEQNYSHHTACISSSAPLCPWPICCILICGMACCCCHAAAFTENLHCQIYLQHHNLALRSCN